jgi:hypothetical protein
MLLYSMSWEKKTYSIYSVWSSCNMSEKLLRATKFQTSSLCVHVGLLVQQALCDMKLFFWIWGNLTPPKAYFVGPGEGVKPRLSQTLIKDARLDSNSRPTVQISNPLPSCYAPWERCVIWNDREGNSFY